MRKKKFMDKIADSTAGVMLAAVFETIEKLDLTDEQKVTEIRNYRIGLEALGMEFKPIDPADLEKPDNG